MWLKSCPRCLGDLILESDLHGPFVSCIQCGTILSRSQEHALLGLSRIEPSATRTEALRRVAKRVVAGG